MTPARPRALPALVCALLVMLGLLAGLVQAGIVQNPDKRQKIMGRAEDVGKAYQVKRNIACDLCRVVVYEFWWKTASARNENEYYRILEERCHTNGNINPSLAVDYWVDEDEQMDLYHDFRTRGVELACSELVAEHGELLVDRTMALRKEYQRLTEGMNIPRRRHQDQVFLSRLHADVCQAVLGISSEELAANADAVAAAQADGVFEENEKLRALPLEAPRGALKSTCTSDPGMREITAHPGGLPARVLEAEAQAWAAEWAAGQAELEGMRPTPDALEEHKELLRKARVQRQREEMEKQHKEKLSKERSKRRLKPDNTKSDL